MGKLAVKLIGEQKHKYIQNFGISIFVYNSLKFKVCSKCVMVIYDMSVDSYFPSFNLMCAAYSEEKIRLLPLSSFVIMIISHVEGYWFVHIDICFIYITNLSLCLRP